MYLQEAEVVDPVLAVDVWSLVQAEQPSFPIALLYLPTSHGVHVPESLLK